MSVAGKRHTAVVAVTVMTAVLLLAVPVLFALQMRDGPVAPDRAVLAVAGPVLVAQALAERADGLPGDAFDGRAVESVAVAEDSVRDGTAAVAVVVDFRDESDTLLVSTTTDPDLVAEYRVRLEAVSTSFGRSLEVETVEPTAGDEVGRRSPYVVTFVGVCAGVGLAVLLSLWLGPVAATATRGALRLVALAAAAAAIGAGLAVSTTGDGLLLRALASALLVAVVAWLVLALESVVGLRGLALATALLLGFAVPLLTYLEPAALPDPWGWVLPWTPHGAALDLSRDLLYFETSSGRSWTVLSTWGVVAVLTLVAARRNRPA